MKSIKKYSVLEVNISTANYQQVVESIMRTAKAKQRLTVAPVASHPVTLATKDSKLKQALNSFDFVLPDSQYVLWSLNFLYKTSFKKRIYGPKLFLDICKKAETERLKIFLYGNRLDLLKTVLIRKYPKLKISGIDLQHKAIKKNDCKKLESKLKLTKADILLIGLGSPLQHKLAKFLTKSNIPIIMVGAAFDFVAGLKPQAPKWMQNSGLEWLFRLWQEPKRLWKRYFIYGLIYLAQFFLYKLLSKYEKK